MEELKENCGIYKITNVINDKFYIGSSIRIDARFKEHKKLLKSNKHHSMHLQNAYNKYGDENFKYEVIEICLESILAEREQYYIDTFLPEYNIAKVAYQFTHNFGENAKEKISNTLKEKYASGEITTYKQDHLWIKCYVYDANSMTFYGEFDNLSEAYRKINNLGETDKTHWGSRKLFKLLYSQYIISDVEEEDILNFCTKIAYKINSSKGNYIISEKNGAITYYKSVTECCEKLNIAKTTIHRRLKNENSVYELKDGTKIYYLVQYKPI